MIKRVGLVLRMAVTRKEHADDALRHRKVAESCHQRRIDAAAQADDEPARAGGMGAFTKPGGDGVRTTHGDRS